MRCVYVYRCICVSVCVRACVGRWRQRSGSRCQDNAPWRMSSDRMVPFLVERRESSYLSGQRAVSPPPSSSVGAAKATRQSFSACLASRTGGRRRTEPSRAIEAEAEAETAGRSSSSSSSRGRRPQTIRCEAVYDCPVRPARTLWQRRRRRQKKGRDGNGGGGLARSLGRS